MDYRYIAIDDVHGDELWADVADLVVRRVSLSEFDQLVEVGYLDLDGRILLELDFSDA